MNRIVLLDTETTGLDPATSRCIEVACIKYDLDASAVVEVFSSLIHAEENQAERVNRIPVSLLRRAPKPETVWKQLESFIGWECDAIVAHRAAFDSSFVPSVYTCGRPWICSKFDIEWPHGKPGESLTYLALAHGVPVFTAHRAMADVETMVRLFQRVQETGHDLRAMLVRAMRPKKRFAAQVSYDEREKAKSAGFAWDGAKKQWWREMPPEDAAKLPFPVQEVVA